MHYVIVAAILVRLVDTLGWLVQHHWRKTNTVCNPFNNTCMRKIHVMKLMVNDNEWLGPLCWVSTYFLNQVMRWSACFTWDTRTHVIDKDAVVSSKTMAWYFDRAHVATSKAAGEKQWGSWEVMCWVTQCQKSLLKNNSWYKFRWLCKMHP